MKKTAPKESSPAILTITNGMQLRITATGKDLSPISITLRLSRLSAEHLSAALGGYADHRRAKLMPATSQVFAECVPDSKELSVVVYKKAPQPTSSEPERPRQSEDLDSYVKRCHGIGGKC